MDKAIVTVLLIICGIVATLAMFNGLFPAISQSQGAINQAAEQASERMESRIEIIQAGASGSEVTLWVKNVGTVTIEDVSRSDLLYGATTNPIPVVYGLPASPPSWAYVFVGSATAWEPAATIGVTVTLASPVASGTYVVKFVIPNGVSDEATFSVA